MGLTLTEKIIKDHLVSGNMTRGERIAIHIDQTLTQDATGTMAYLELEALGIDKIKTDFSVDNISQVTYVTEKDESAVDTYKSIGKISQNMTDYVNDITVTLLKY